MRTTDFVIIGGGVVGLTIALEMKRRYPNHSVTLLEKETRCGSHASTRNSGVLHAGFYYPPGSLKARLTVEGNRRLRAYCLERGLRVNACGKLVVTRSERELPALTELHSRGQRNGCSTEIITARDAIALEPRVQTVEKALFSPETSTVNPSSVMSALEQDAVSAGIRILTSNPYLNRDRRSSERVRTGQGTISAGYVINAAGLYADRVAHDYGFGSEYVILPFKGLYLYADEGTEPLQRHIYAVPDLGNQFHLGVHFTVTAEGRTKLGPTAIPAFWREHYNGWRNFNLREALEIVVRELRLFASDDFGFRRLAIQEMLKYSRRKLVEIGSSLVRGSSARHFTSWGPAGIRAQLFNVRTRRLELDFRLEGDRQSMHVLNAVSPAFTCCFPFAEYVADAIDEQFGSTSLSPGSAGSDTRTVRNREAEARGGQSFAP